MIRSRRNFISTCAACGACMTMAPLASALTPSVTAQGKPPSRMRIRIVFALHDVIQPGPDWPNVGFDFGPVMENISNVLRKQLPQFEFVSSMAAGETEAVKMVEQDRKENTDGYIVYQLNCWNRVVQTIAKTGKPVLYADFQFGGSGGFLVYTSAFLKEQAPNVGFVASSRISDLVAAVKCFEITAKGGPVNDFTAAVTKTRISSTPAQGNMACLQYELHTIGAGECVRRLKQSKILAFRDEKSAIADPVMNIPVEYLPFAEVNRAWETANRDSARAMVERWQLHTEIQGIPAETLQTSAAFYIGMKSVMKNHDANAITVNCLGGFYGGSIHAYPCLGFYELQNEGLVGACECDIRSTAAMLAFSIMTEGRPGMISDPVIDTSKRQIIYAHCVASNRVFGPEGPESPVTIMTHSEDRQGASVRAVLPVDYMTTTLQVDQSRKEILFHRAKAITNDPDDRACRTKLCAEPVGDMEKLFRHWDWGWHRVTFYGDLKEPVYELADAIGWKVVEEA